MAELATRGTGAALVAHWDWAIERGLVNKNTGRSIKAAVNQVLSIEDGWERMRVDDMDVEGLLLRFRNLSGISPSSLAAYEARFRQAVASYLDYLNNPTTYRPSQRRPRSAAPKSAGSGGDRRTAAATSAATPPEPKSITPASGALGTEHSDFVTYPLPLRPKVFAELRLPVDLTREEAERIGAFALAVAVRKPDESAT